MAEVYGLQIKSSGARSVLNSGAVQADLLGRAQSIAATASSLGVECTADVRSGKNRAHAMVKTKGLNAARANARTNALLKAMDSGM